MNVKVLPQRRYQPVTDIEEARMQRQAEARPKTLWEKQFEEICKAIVLSKRNKK